MSMGNSSPSIQPARAIGKKEVQTNRSSDGESQAGSNIERRFSIKKYPDQNNLARSEKTM
jgi:hypothetical protein